MRLRHICEVCGRDEILDSDEAFDAGWDYPPRMGVFGVAGPRTCPDCPLAKTVWAAIALDGITPDQLSQRHRAALDRIAGEPESILVPADNQPD